MGDPVSMTLQLGRLVVREGAPEIPDCISSTSTKHFIVYKRGFGCTFNMDVCYPKSGPPTPDVHFRKFDVTSRWGRHYTS